MTVSAKTDIREKAKKCIDLADDTTVKMILAMLEVQSKEESSYEKEILKRFDDYEQGKVTPISLDDLEKSVRNNHKKRSRD